MSTELSSKWANPALRVLAEDAVVGCVRLVRGLRKLGENLSSAAGSSRAAVGDQSNPSTTPKAAAIRPPLPRGGQAAKQEPHNSGEESEEEESEETSRGAVSEGEHRENSGDRESIGRRENRQPTKYSRSGGAGRVPREPSLPPPPPVRSEDTHRRSSHRPREGHRDGDQSQRRRRAHRGGRKHKRLYRVLEDPTVSIHRSVATGFWDQTPSRQGAGALDRRR